MRRINISILALSLLAGGWSPATSNPVATTEPQVLSRSAASLAFDTPLAMAGGSIDLPRDIRRPGAFAGYEDSVTSYSYVKVDDRDTGDSQATYRRHAISETVAVTHQ